MWFKSKLRIETILDVFDKRNELIWSSLITSLSVAQPLVGASKANTVLKNENFLRILLIETSIYTFLFFDLSFFAKGIDDKKRQYITKHIFDRICDQSSINLKQLQELIEPREKLFVALVTSDENHLGENLKSFVERVVYAFSNGKLCSTAIAITNDPIFVFQVYSAFQTEYIEGMKSSNLKKLLEDIRSKPIEGMS